MALYIFSQRSECSIVVVIIISIELLSLAMANVRMCVRERARAHTIGCVEFRSIHEEKF